MQLNALNYIKDTATDSFKKLISHYVLRFAMLLTPLLCASLSLLQVNTYKAISITQQMHAVISSFQQKNNNVIKFFL